MMGRSSTAKKSTLVAMPANELAMGAIKTEQQLGEFGPFSTSDSGFWRFLGLTAACRQPPLRRQLDGVQHDVSCPLGLIPKPMVR